MTTKLAVFNRALQILGESPLATIGEDVEKGRVLHNIWDGGVVDFCLEQGQWNFAMRSSSLTYDPGITTEFGLTYGYDLPDDFIRWAAVSIDEYNEAYCTDYKMEGERRLFSDNDEIFVRYVSNDDAYGLALANWPRSFEEYVAHCMAERACLPLGRSESAADRLEQKTVMALVNAKNKDAANEAIRRPRRTSVTRARAGGY